MVGLGPKTQIRIDRSWKVDLIIFQLQSFLDSLQKGKIFTKETKTMILDRADKIDGYGFYAQIEMLENHSV